MFFFCFKFIVVNEIVMCQSNPSLIKKPKNHLLPIFSPDFTLNGQIWLGYDEKWIFVKLLGTFTC